MSNILFCTAILVVTGYGRMWVMVGFYHLLVGAGFCHTLVEAGFCDAKPLQYLDHALPPRSIR
ncbi:MAG: hypothetical protein AB4058_17985 [Microcystaceae cyanobacterium]